MLHFILGRAGTGKTRRIAEEIAREITETSRPVVLLVPEQQTVAWETKMAALLPVSANLRLEITNFTRLANSVFREYGGLADPVVDEGSRTLLVWRAMLSVWESLSVYRSPDGTGAGREDRNLPKLLRAVDDFKAAGISPAEAADALDRLERLREEEAEPGDASDAESRSENAGDLVSRMRDAVLVYAAYEELLHRDRIDRGDLFANLEKTLRLHPYFRGKAVFVDSFFSLTGAEEKILGQIFAQADEAWVSFACPPDAALWDDEQQFAEVREFYKTAVRLASRAGKEIEKIPLAENFRHRCAPALARVEGSLFRYAAPLPTEPLEDGDRIRILACADLWDEAEACASVIDGLLREGYACRQIAVVARNIETRQGILDTALRNHGIPCFLSESTDVSHSPAVRLVLAALAVEANGWQRRDMIRLLKTGLTPAEDLAPEPPADRESEGGPSFAPYAADAFEEYCAAWNIRGRRMFTSPRWTMNPAGYQVDFTEAGRAMLDAANAVKDRIVPPLDNLLSVFRGGPAPVREIAERIVYFAEDCALDTRLGQLADSFRQLGMPGDALRTEASWDAVCRILDSMAENLGDTSLDAGRFAGLFARAAAALDTGTIPTGQDEVVLGSASGVRFDEAKCVIMLGTVDGEFPGTVSDGPSFFDDRDKQILETVGLAVGGPDTAVQAAREKFMFYRTAASASERLFLLAPLGPGKSLSDGAARIEAILKSAGVSPTAVFGELPLSEIVHHPATAEYLLSRRPAEEDRKLLAAVTGRGPETKVPLTAEDDRLPPASRENGAKMRLSQSKIESFLSCPFLYACRYRVKIAEEVRAEITAASVGTFVHHVLERYFTECPPELLPMPEEEMRATADGIIADYLGELGRASGGALSPDGRLNYLFRRLERHVMVFLRAISEELAQSGFAPAAYEMPIGLGGPEISAEPIRIRTPDGAEVTLDGIADRVDLWKAPDGREYVRIVDYKTGSTSFSLERVARGLDVQALLYLFSVWKNGMPGERGRTKPLRIPAGAVYFTVKPQPVGAPHLLSAEEAEKQAEEKIERTGVYLGEEEVLRAMDGELSGRFVPLKETKDGTLTGRGKANLVTLEQFGALYEQLGETIGKIAGEMRSGAAEARPHRTGSSDPCGWCAHRMVCRAAELPD